MGNMNGKRKRAVPARLARPILAVLIGLGSRPAGALALDDGIVVHQREGCAYVLVETPSGLALLRWLDGEEPLQGDRVIGDFNLFQTCRLFNQTKSRRFTAEMRAYVSTTDDAMAAYHRFCR